MVDIRRYVCYTSIIKERKEESGWVKAGEEKEALSTGPR